MAWPRKIGWIKAQCFRTFMQKYAIVSFSVHRETFPLPAIRETSPTSGAGKRFGLPEFENRPSVQTAENRYILRKVENCPQGRLVFRMAQRLANIPSRIILPQVLKISSK